MAQEFWVKTHGQVQGPFTASQLRQLARAGRLKPDHGISEDRQRWTPARDVKGLAWTDSASVGESPRSSRARDESAQSAPDESNEPAELGLAELDEDQAERAPASWQQGPWEPPPEPQESGMDLAELLEDAPQPDSRPGNERLAAASARAAPMSASMIVSNSQTAIGRGVFLAGGGLAILCPILLALLSFGAKSSSGLLPIAFIAMTFTFVAATGILALGVAGSRVRIEITAGQSGPARAAITSYFAFLPTHQRDTALTARDLLVMRRSRAIAIGWRGSYFLLSGLKRSRDADLTLELRTVENPQPIFLCRRVAEDFVNARLDAPESFQRIIALFRKAVPNIDVFDET